MHNETRKSEEPKVTHQRFKNACERYYKTEDRARFMAVVIGVLGEHVDVSVMDSAIVAGDEYVQMHYPKTPCVNTLQNDAAIRRRDSE